MRKVAVPLAKHSPIFGQLASWQTVLSFKSFNKFAVLPILSTWGALTLNHSGFAIKLADLLFKLIRSSYLILFYKKQAELTINNSKDCD